MLELLNKNEFFAKKMLNKKTGVPRNMVYSLKVHNDFLEMWVETGIIGVGLFVYLLTQITYNPLSAGFLAMVLVSGMFFFILGISHTAIPFW
ncbi:MAG: hypothetical protein WC208_15855, partial [Gallionella sp.]